MKSKFLLIIMLLFSNGLFAESELSSYENRIPFNYKPTPELELTINKKGKIIQVIYPNKNTQILTTLESKNWNNPENITADFNNDGYMDLGIWVGVNPRGLNEAYDIFLWDDENLKLKKIGGLTNPSIQSELIIETIFVPFTMCENDESICAQKFRYTLKDDQLTTHSSVIPRKDNTSEITFYRNEKKVKTVTVPFDQINTETKEWNLSVKTL